MAHKVVREYWVAQDGSEFITEAAAQHHDSLLRCQRLIRSAMQAYNSNDEDIIDELVDKLARNSVMAHTLSEELRNLANLHEAVRRQR